MLQGNNFLQKYTYDSGLVVQLKPGNQCFPATNMWLQELPKDLFSIPKMWVKL